MKKRKIGTRGRILFDEIDLDILELLNISDTGLLVIDIVDKLKIKHKNLKPHIDKLRATGLIMTHQIESSPNNWEVRLIVPSFFKSLIGSSFDEIPKSAQEKISEDIDFLEQTLYSLNKVKTYYRNKDENKLIDYDLRRKKQK